MAITITWKIDALDCIPDAQGKTDYVICAHWRCNGTDGTFNGSVYSTQSFEVNADDPNYVPYDQLTEALVISWVQAAMGVETVAATEENVINQIQDQINPKIVTPALPWATPAAEAA